MDTQVTAHARLRVSLHDAHYGGGDGIAAGAFVLRVFGDLVTEITIRTDGDEGLLAEYESVKFTSPVMPGDYIEADATLLRRTRLRRTVALEARKVIAARYHERETKAEVLSEPVVVCRAIATTVVPFGVVTENQRMKGLCNDA
jgi:3-aminobutyryl-CoA ammonia-lyase